MQADEISLPEVPAMGQFARFFKDNNTDYIEIGFTGSKDTVVKKAGPDHMAKFRDEWNAYCDGIPLKQRAGTPLTTVESVDERRAAVLVTQNVHTAEELAALSDAQCQALGHGTLTARENARKMMGMRQVERQQATIAAMSAATAKMAGGVEAAEVAALKSEVGEVKAMLGDILKALAERTEPKKRGRPPKTEG